MSSNDEYILSVGAGQSQVPLILKIKEMGWKVISCDADAQAPGKMISDLFINVSTYEAKSIIDAIVAKDVKLIAVLTRSTGKPVVSCAKIAKHFKLPGLDIDNSKIFTHKQKLLHALRQHDIAAPRIFDINSPIDYPVFVKPSNTVKSHAAMSLCNSSKDLEQAYSNAASVSLDGSVNIEEYLLGQDIVSIDFVCNSQIFHLCTIGEISNGPPSFDGIGWYTVSQKLDEVAKSQFSHMKNALSIHHGFFQTAMKFNPVNEQCKIYEVHAEIGGDKVNDVFIPTISNGYDVFENNIHLALGKFPEPIKQTVPMLLLFKQKLEQYSIKLPDSGYKVYSEIDDCLMLSFTYQWQLNDFLSKNTGKSFSFNTGVYV
ncbi:hypothetical protein L2744_14550 [Shewanella profunda]|uniref:ATP-grasp domain-containing protein n=1 Tax=Shewanella profunda TaxID=254793 RepID=UPI00200C4999|nr:hypothetical protein [Shewanella profunda]MCL1090794.1 hypothetical protein [Shewanella profunda]